MQLHEMVLTDPEQAAALQDVGFLNQFLHRTSPSEAARRLGISANLAHHHVKRHAALGLLREVKREAGRVYYQLAARTFKHARTLVPVDDAKHRVTSTVSRLQQKFLAEYERSSRSMPEDEDDWTVYGFTDSTSPYIPTGSSFEDLPGAKRAHLQVRSFRLSAARYQQLVTALQQTLEEFEADPAEGTCTIAILAFNGLLQPGQEDSRMISSFMPPSPHRHTG